MPLSEKGNYISNPRQGHFMERAAPAVMPGAEKTPISGNGGEVTLVIHKRADGSMTATRSAGGEASTEEHASYDDLMARLPEYLGESAPEMAEAPEMDMEEPPESNEAS